MEQHHRVAARRSLKVESPEGKTLTWSIPDSEATITMPGGVLNRLKAQVANGYALLPKRGAEVGGVLLGHVVSGPPLQAHIADFVPVNCEYRFGPTFTLSSTDLAGLEQILAELTARTDVSVIGYFRSCTGRDLALDDADAELLRAFFPGPSMIVLSIKPLSLRKCVAWFFFNDHGTTCTVPTHPPFPFDDEQSETVPPPKPIQAPVEPLLAPPPENPPAFDQAPAAAVEPVPALIPDVIRPPAPTPRPRPYWQWIALSLMLLAAAIAGYRSGVASIPPISPPPGPPVPTTPPFTASSAPTPPKPLPPVVPAALVFRAEPDVPPGIRARIEQLVVIRVDLRIDATGKVDAAKAQGDGDAVFRFLAERAVVAAQSSKFRPARAADGTPLPSTALLTFVFEPPPL